MKRLVFDLRDNPGGPLDQAIRIANFFIPRGELIVYLRGRVPSFFGPDFLVQRVLQLVGGALELRDALPQLLPELGQFTGPEDDQGDRKNDEQFRKAY